MIDTRISYFYDRNILQQSKHTVLLLLLIFSLFSMKRVIAQNLVVNPSFEQTVNGCSGFPIAAEGMSDLVNWDNISNNTPADTCSTPDLFSTCNNSIAVPGFAPTIGVPSNALGYQCPRTGEKYAGVITYDPIGSYREYVQGQLSSPLQAGQTYCVSFYVSLADSMPYATDNIGVHFANTHQVWAAPCNAPYTPVGLTPQLNYNCVLTDTEWVRLQWDYVATGGEQYIIIGNFYDNGSTTVNTTGQSLVPNPYAYYYLDDVSVQAGSCCGADIQLAGNTDCDNWSATGGNGVPTTINICTDDPAFDLSSGNIIDASSCTAPTAGTWSGTGITNSTTGTFDPAVSGTGTFTIIYNETCGSSTIDISVAPCMEICIETNGDLTVNGGTGPFNWSEWDAGGSTPITNQTECQNCGYSWFLGQCLNGIIPVTDCVVPAGYQVFTTGTTITPTSNFPLQVEDALGNTVVIPDLNNIPGCSACPTITITMSGVSDISCNGLSDGSASASASGGTAGYTYTWSPGNLNGASQNNLAQGTYIINVSDANSCPGSTTVTINEPTAISVNTNSTPTSCGQLNGTVSVSASGGTGTLSYLWSPGGATSSTVSGLSAGTYNVVVTDANGCTSNGSATISNTNGPDLALQSSSDVSCNGANDGQASVSATGGTGPYNYSWIPGSLSGASQSNLSGGNYTVTVTDASGCTDLLTITINEPAALVLNSNNVTAATCGSNDGQATVSATGGTGSYNYNWSPSGGTSATATNLAGGSYSVTVTDANSCSEVINITVPTTGGPILSVTNISDATCYGSSDGSATISASGGTSPYTYLWNPSGGTSATANNLSAGSYTVSVTDAIGCISLENVTIGEPNEILLSESITDEDCGQSNGSISVGASGGTGNLTYLWNPGGETTPSISGLSGGSYSITVADQSGCTITSSYVVNIVGGIPVVISPSSATIESGEQILLTASGANTYVWSPTSGLSCSNCTSPVASPETTTTYIVTGTDLSGCSGSDTITVYVVINCADLFIPTIFSPNGSGPNANEYLCVYGSCISELKFKVFDRWGELVFQTDEAYQTSTADKSALCWDGTFRGKPVQEGAYVYTVYARLFDDTVIEKSGNITIVR